MRGKFTKKHLPVDDEELIPNEIITYEIVNILDMDILKELANNIEKLQVLRQTDTVSKDDSRQFILSSMDTLNSFINEMAKGACCCIKYRYFRLKPEIEESLGLMTIVSREQHDRPLEAIYNCQCTVCQTVFICNQSEVRFGTGYYWRRKNNENYLPKINSSV